MRLRWSSRLVRAALVLLAAALGAPVFGMCVPFTLLELRLVPSFGLGNVLYVIGGAALGLLVGGLGGARALRGAGDAPPRRYLALVLAFVATLAAAMLAARYGGAFAHV